tara:strand:+ start:785 stop:973 length:189 start_codon:yes stop_codon:yes gene_type:complete
MATQEFETQDEAQEAAAKMTGEKSIYKDGDKWVIYTADAKPKAKAKKPKAEGKDENGMYTNG